MQEQKIDNSEKENKEEQFLNSKEVGEIEDNHPTNNTNTEGNNVNSFPTVDETKYDSVYHTIPKTEEILTI